jgi:hypothetical protein
MIFHTTSEFFAYLCFLSVFPILIVSLFGDTHKFSSIYYADDNSFVAIRRSKTKTTLDFEEYTI